MKNDEIIFTEGNSKAVKDNTLIIADKFNYKKNQNILIADGKVEIENKVNDYYIQANYVIYNINTKKYTTKGKTKAKIDSRYIFKSRDVTLDKNEKILKSSEKTNLEDLKDFNLYNLSKFIYFYERENLRGKNIKVINKFNKNEKSDKLFFKDGFIEFSNNKFISSNTEIFLHRSLFDKERNINDEEDKNFLNKNDPRIFGVSSSGDSEKVVLKKAVFTSCEDKKDKCPPWSMKAEKITHDRIKREIHYKDAVLNIYDVPVFYFPKFFHPDPSVDRRSGLLQPRLNNSDLLGTSFNLPYFHVISENKDITIKPTIFDNRIYMLQNEYRQENKNSSFIADFSYTKGYQSSYSQNQYTNRNSISHLFSKFDLDLNLKNFDLSKFNVFVEKINNDTYLKVFEDAFLVNKKFEEDLKDKNNLTSGMILSLDNEDYNFTTGITAYENLQLDNNDRYQYVLPHYDFSQNLFSNNTGSLNFSSNGKNSLSDTNNLRSSINNTINYTSDDLYSKSGFLNNFGIYFKNVNVTGKKDPKYKSNIQSELLNIYEFNSSFPLIKFDKNYSNYITPKISFRINPSDMKNHSTDDRLITTDNIFDIGRLGISDSYESGKSLTLGVDLKKENIVDIDKYFEIKFASVLRDKDEDKIPKSSSLNRTSSNLFGSIENSFSEFFSLNYDFAVDNDLNKFEHNSIDATFKVNNFVTTFNFLEKNGEMGDVNTLENVTQYTLDENNSLIFKTRRNRKISLTEYYDLVYEYQNDCLTAGIKYRKTYYEDRDLRSKEDLFLTITLFPLTTFDQKIEDSAWRGDNAIQNLFD